MIIVKLSLTAQTSYTTAIANIGSVWIATGYTKPSTFIVYRPSLQLLLGLEEDNKNCLRMRTQLAIYSYQSVCLKASMACSYKTIDCQKVTTTTDCSTYEKPDSEKEFTNYAKKNRITQATRVLTQALFSKFPAISCTLAILQGLWLDQFKED